jgi:hypothetical protein
MVFRRDKKGGGWHVPPYAREEEMEFYRRISAGPMTICRGARKPVRAFRERNQANCCMLSRWNSRGHLPGRSRSVKSALVASIKFRSYHDRR